MMNTDKRVSQSSNMVGNSFNLLLILSLLLSSIALTSSQAPAHQKQSVYIEPGLSASTAGTLSVIVTARDSQAAAHAVAQAGGTVTSDLWLVHAVAATIAPQKLALLGAMDGIQSIVANQGVQKADGPYWDGYVTNTRAKRDPITLKTTLYAPVTYLPDGGFVSIDQNGNVLIVNADGSTRAQLNLSGGPFLTPAVVGADGTLYIVGQTMRIYALNPDGSTRWQFAINGSTNKFLGNLSLGPNNTVYAADNARTIYLLDAASGAQEVKKEAVQGLEDAARVKAREEAQKQADQLVKEDLEGHLFGLQGGVTRMEHHPSAMPTHAQLLNDGVRFLIAEPVQDGLNGSFNELRKGDFQARERGTWFGGGHAADAAQHEAAPT